jgi:hypothetical protein
VFDVTLVVSLPVEQRHEPAGGIRPWLDILVLAGTPDVLQNPRITRNLADNGINSGIRLLRSYLLRRRG